MPVVKHKEGIGSELHRRIFYSFRMSLINWHERARHKSLKTVVVIVADNDHDLGLWTYKEISMLEL